MCNPACIQFAISHILRQDVAGKSVLEVGSYNMNGSFRDHIRYFAPASYFGVDAQPGPGVDQECNAESLLEEFGPCSFDVVLSTEMLEHVADWRKVITNLKQVLKPGGTVILTTRSFGFPHHDYPRDYWRFETHDMQAIFLDFHIQALMPDPSEPGVFVKATRPDPYRETDLSRIALYSMSERKRSLRRIG
jgi:SAM-dependent methyltransferase